MISVFFIYHENEQQFAIILFLSLSLFFMLVFTFSFSVRTNIPCRLSIFFFFYRPFFDSYSQRERISFLFSIYSPKQQYPWSSWFCNWMAKALCHRVSIHFLSLCPSRCVCSWWNKLNFKLHYGTRATFPLCNSIYSTVFLHSLRIRKKRHRLKWVAT